MTYIVKTLLRSFLLIGYPGYTEPAVFLTFCSNSKELKGVRQFLTVNILSNSCLGALRSHSFSLIGLFLMFGQT